MKLLSLPISVKCQNGKGKKARTQRMCTHIIATGRTSERLPAMGGVHAHSHYRGWQNEPTIQDCQLREECMCTHITAAGRTSQQSKVASHGRSACALTSPQLVGRGNGCQQREECVCTRITVASRENKLEKRWYQW